MTWHTLLGMAVILSLGPFTTNGLCQGAAEYSVITSHAAAATVKGGTVLDKATQQLAGHLGQKVSESAEQSRQRTRASGDRRVPAAGSVGTAKGMEILYGAGNAKTSGVARNPGSPSQPCITPSGKDSPKSKAGLTCKEETQEKYPSVVNLSFGK